MKVKMLTCLFVLILTASLCAQETNRVTAAELQKAVKGLVSRLDSLPGPLKFTRMEVKKYQQEDREVLVLEDNILDLLRSGDESSYANLERILEPILKRRVRYDSPLEEFWSAMGSHFMGSGVNAEFRNALLMRYLSRKDVPTQVKVWMAIGLPSYPGARDVVPEDLLLDVWTEFLAIKEIAFFYEAYRAGLQSTPVRDERGKVTGMKTTLAPGAGPISLLMTGRDVACEMIQEMYHPPEVKWPDPAPDKPTTPEIQAQRETAAKAAEKWIEKRRIRYRLKAALIEALENHRDTGLTGREALRNAFGLLVGYTEKDTQAMAERLMKLMLAELESKDRDGIFLAELASAIERICEKDGTAIRSAGDQDLTGMETGRKWMGEVITASRDRPMSYFDRRAWQAIAERLSILIEMK